MTSKQFVFASCFFLLSAAGCAGNDSGASCPGGCPTTQVCCAGRCVFTEIDVGNCGACGSVCTGTCGGGVCTPTTGTDSGTPGSCSPTCASDQRCCGTSCVDRSQPANVDGRPSSTEDPRAPFNNCNGCGLRCDPERAISCSIRPSGTSPECACGDFGQCPPGDVCANDGTRYQCVNTATSTTNCGTIGNRCADGEACTGGMCVCAGTSARCGAGQACCGGVGCVDVTSDAMNCGACGNICAGDESCSGGMCVCGTGAGARACTPPSATAPGESCCGGICVANNASNCGCGVVCDSDEMCIYGSGFGGGASRLCCSAAPAFPGFPAFCTDFGGFDAGGGFGFDGGFPSP